MEINPIQQNLIEKEKPSEKLKSLEKCLFCEGNLVKKGIRKKKFESVQVYFCKKCNKKITPVISKNKTYPLRIILESLTLFNRLTPLGKIPEIIKEKYSLDINVRTISAWLEEYKDFIPFLRMHEFAQKNSLKKI